MLRGVTAGSRAAPAGDLSRHYRRPDPGQLAARVEELARACDAASSGDQVCALIRTWNEVRCGVETSANLSFIRFQQDTRDKEARAEEEFWSDTRPLLRELDVLHARTLLRSRFRDAIDATFGGQLLRLKDCAERTFAPAIRRSVAEEAHLVLRYEELRARTEIEFRGETLNLDGIAAHFSSADRHTRMLAQQAAEKFLERHAAELDDLFDGLVKLRDAMGRGVGFDSFTPLGYRLQVRPDYGPAEVAVFRDEVRREITPRVEAVFRARARRLGIPKLLFHDEAVADPRGNPRPLGDAAFCLKQARRAYHELGPETAEFIDMMIDRGHLDLDCRPGKAGGGFSAPLPDVGAPFVFANLNGSWRDAGILTHELGHALQCHRSRGQPLLEYASATSEIAEIHSFGSELLCHPWMDLFFGAAEADRFRRLHLENTLVMMVHQAAGDAFQHEVYANPGLLPAQRHALWNDVLRTYLPGRDYGGHFPYLERGTGWAAIMHFFRIPFYMIDYALAQTCALQLWVRAQTDRPRALRDYLALCDAGGSLPYQDTLRVADLRSPLTPGCLGEVAGQLDRHLSESG